MCGIVGYIGNGNAVDTIVDGLKKLEYRGYDSAGIAIPGDNKEISIVRSVGRIANLVSALEEHKLKSNMGIGHTRWATHGRPSEFNAHPHQSGHIALVHNGIIENYREIKDELISKGYKFTSDTDTEVVAHLINMLYTGDLLEAVRQAVHKIKGAYALAVISSREPDKIVGARKDSPLVVGLSPDTNEYLLVSDVSAGLEVTRDFIRLGEEELAVISAAGVKLINKDGQKIEPEITHIDWDPVMAEKAGYEDFMIKEIHEQPRTIIDTLRGKIIHDEGKIFLGELDELEKRIGNLERIILLGCGTSWHSSLLGKLFIEKYAHIPVEVDVSSEFTHRELPLNENILAVCISQSGETADTKAALRAAKARGAKTAAICNVVGSAIATEADYVIYTHAGPEISVASTKAFTCQTLTLFLLALWLGEKRKATGNQKVAELLTDLLRIPDKINTILENQDEIKAVAEHYKDIRHFMYLGRNFSCPIAMEGSLKLKEITYIHAEAYPSGELKHGPIALLDKNFPVMVFAPDIKVREKIFSSLQEVTARGAQVVGVFSESGRHNHPECEFQLFVPDCAEEEMTTFLTVVVAQLFAYYSAKALGRDVDKPRNLAKSVTVE